MGKSKAKGTKAESAVVQYLRDNGFPYAERLALQGNKDRGDVTGIPGVVIEVKDHVRTELAEWLKELEEEMGNAKTSLGGVWHKKRGTTDPGRWYVTMDGEAFVALLQEALQ